MSLLVYFPQAGLTCTLFGPWICLSQHHHHCCGCLDGHPVEYCLDNLWFCHFSLDFVFFCIASIPLLLLEWQCLPNLWLSLLTPCHVISLKCNNTDVVYLLQLTAYLQVYFKCECLQYALLHLHIFTEAHLKHGLLIPVVFTWLVSWLSIDVCPWYLQFLYIWVFTNLLSL